MMNDILFYDTSSLLLAGEKLFKQDKFLVSSISFNELERIKTSSNKDPEIKYTARLLMRLFDEHPDSYEVVIHNLNNEKAICDKSLDLTNDTKILSDAVWLNDNKYVDRVVFVTNDLALKHIANLFFGSAMIQSIEEETEDYCGYKEVTADEETLAKFYEDPSYNYFDLLIGEYLVLKNQEKEVVDLRKWDGSSHKYLNISGFNSRWFGKTNPINNDIYQKMLFDSLNTNQFTIIRGKAGSGKSYIALSYLINQLEYGIIDKIIIFCNCVATKDSAKLGFYPGDKNTKLLDSQIGNFLVGKFGDMEAVKQLIEQGILVLVPTADCRGMDIGIRAGIYVTEAQNTTVDLMQLILQRVGDDCICVIEGDDKAQVDLNVYHGNNNGLIRASQVFRGQDYYGEVKLQNCYRSKIAAQADLMKM